MNKRQFGFTLLLLFLASFTFSASYMIATAQAAPCPCNFYCACAESTHPGVWLDPPMNTICGNSQTNLNCMCPCT